MTLVEVAKKAGVSKTTVSAILNNDPGYSYRPETVERVHRSAKVIGYRPHSTASLMRAKRTYLIGIFAANLRGDSSMTIVDALIKDIKKHEPYRPMFIDPQVLREPGPAAVGFELLEGLFWTLPRRDDKILKDLLARADAPEIVTMTYQYPKSWPVSSVIVQSGDGFCQATDHLIKLGHRHIAIIYRAMPKSDDRFNGYQCALKQGGITPDPAYCLPLPDEYEPDSYFRAGLELTLQAFAHAGPPPTAIVCHNDEVALGVIKGARQLKLKVPNDLSVVGLGGAALSEYSYPLLSTVEIPMQEEAAAAVELMMKRLSHKQQSSGELRKLPCKLRVAESTAPLSHAARRGKQRPAEK